MRGRNLRRTLVAAGLVAASAVLVLVLAVAGLLAFIVTSAGAGSSWNASMDELSAARFFRHWAMAFLVIRESDMSVLLFFADASSVLFRLQDQYTRTSQPSSVTATVTSHWADGFPSSV